MGDGTVQHCSWVTDLGVHKRTGYHLMRGGRARWKMEHETFTTLHNQGYNFEHNDGQGTQHLSAVFATMMLLAFLVDQVPQRGCALFRAVWRKLGRTRLLWERRPALFSPSRRDSMRALFAALWYGWEKSRPILAPDTS